MRFSCSLSRLLSIAIGGVLYLFGPGAAFAAASEDVDAALKHADGIKTSDNPGFKKILADLEDRQDKLTIPERTYLRYLEAWETAYAGDYAKAIPKLDQVIAESSDTTLRFRAGVTAINVLAIASRHEEAYTRLSQLVDWMPKVTDRDTRLLGLGIAALLYNQAGQYDLGLTYAEKWIAEDPTGDGGCKGVYLKLEALYKGAKLHADDAQVADGIAACTKVGEVVYSNLIRTFEANLDIANGKAAEAISLLKANYENAQKTGYPRLTSEFDSILGRAYWAQGNVQLAQQYAQSAVEKAVKNEITKPLADAYEVLYEVTKKKGDYEAALGYHEKYAAADKGYLNDTSARTLAYQMVNQQVLDKKRQIDALNEKNQRLQLQQEVDAKASETFRLYILLLMSGLAFVVLWAYKTKRSQLRFKKLARRDGLTGIFNRQHFIDAAEALLRYCAKSGRDACVVVIDLDHFKLVNDVHGHAAGDLVLKRTVASCQAHLRSIDVFGRLGGEEFAILLPECDVAAARERAERMRRTIAELVDTDPDVEFAVSASFGVASASQAGHELKDLLAHADVALYDAKRGGRNRVSVAEAAAARAAEAAHA
ncbi:MAG TPA: GGDEF domain-containing protein [Rudaea sp.]|nr:GGDEF domain-containing protein [Rudaea sp.]